MNEQPLIDRPPHWGDVRRRTAPAGRAEDTEFAELAAAVFTTAAGSRLLQLMRAFTIERRTPANAPETLLREVEAERRFVARLELARDRGLEARVRSSPKE